MIVKTRGILIFKTRFSDTSMIVHVLTQDAGKQSFLVKAVYAKKSKTRISSLELMNLLEITAWKSSKSDLLIVRELEIWQHYNSIPQNFYKKTMTLFIGEFIHRTIQSPDADSNLYRFVEESMLLFDKLENSYVDFHLRFLSHFSKYLGILPQNDYCPERPFFNILTSSFSPMFGVDNYFFNAQSSRQLHEYLGCSMQDGHNHLFSLADRNVFLDDLMRFYAYHLNHFCGLKSLSVFKAVMH